ncbi:hypothetical protein PHAVU_009G090200 [Phaseolus vulgaris]|uniref:BZIP domain-containing protein n=1 Tax=Phaseolus vulgaris TaxID=3885 RepID=V7AUH6_PHAVU|nr:hypothetical protein PHAVU_009G090200g [Phaseolus vulgaris]ESW08975.1 hypothetical protein PHAVU_009G090200g [Phaseolus vulgaris]
MLNDDWVRAAMTDETFVVEVLLRLKQTVSTESHHRLPLSWGLKQPRSRSRLATAVSRCDAAVSTRCSPTTPLSWSSGASPSATADGYEDSSRQHHAARSKATATSGYTANSASTKRCRRKKTFAELKEEENSLLKERIYLKKEIATINANFEAQGAKNESLKKIKLDIGSNYQKNPSSTSVEPQCMVAGQPHQRIVSPTLTRPTQDDTRSQASESRPNEIESTGERFFLIPDLNMTPSDDVSCTDTLC